LTGSKGEFLKVGRRGRKKKGSLEKKTKIREKGGGRSGQSGRRSGL